MKNVTLGGKARRFRCIDARIKSKGKQKRGRVNFLLHLVRVARSGKWNNNTTVENRNEQRAHDESENRNIIPGVQTKNSGEDASDEFTCYRRTVVFFIKKKELTHIENTRDLR